MIKFEGMLLKVSYIGYVLVKSIMDKHYLEIHFTNDNQYESKLSLEYETKGKAEQALIKLEKKIYDWEYCHNYLTSWLSFINLSIKSVTSSIN